MIVTFPAWYCQCQSLSAYQCVYVHRSYRL